MTVGFKNFVGRSRNSYLTENWIILKVFSKDFDHRFKTSVVKLIHL